MTDPITILGISSLSALLALIVMGSLVRTGIPGTREWCWANAIMIVGMALTISRDFIAPAWSVVIGNAALGAAITLQVVGVRRFFRRRTPYTPLLIAFAIMLSAISYFQYAHNLFGARVVVFSLFHAVFTAWLVTTVVSNRPKDRPKYSYLFMAGIGATACCVNLVRGVLYLGGWASQASPFLATPVHVTFLAIGTMAAPAFTIGMVLMTHDRMSAALERHANFDYLTELLGRRAFISEAQKEWTRAKQFSRPMSIAIVDIDFFKAINDRHGHAGGDEVLSHFAMLLSASTRASDVAGRIGGEEFALLLPETRSAAALQVLERFRIKLQASPCLIANRSVPSTFSAGIAEFSSGESVGALMERADQALYRAKQDGRNRTVIAALPQAEPRRQVPVGAPISATINASAPAQIVPSTATIVSVLPAPMPVPVPASMTATPTISTDA